MTPDFSVSGEVTFEFTALTKPYVILLKAKPGDEKIAEYFSQNGEYTLTNNASLFGEKWTPGVEDSTDVKVYSTILDKSLEELDDGVLEWYVEYKPNELEHEGAYIEDTLPQGLELRTDSAGNLVFDGNISLVELTLNSNGSYYDGDTIELTGDPAIITYDAGTRVLRFNIPDSDQAYRLTYRTDITGDSGTVLNNTVKLFSVGESEVEGGDEYVISDADASATMERSGWFEITKYGVNGEPLPEISVTFNLYAEDGETLFRTGTTDFDGKLTFRGLPIGEYILREVVPDGYVSTGKEYTVVVEKLETGKIFTSVDSKTGDGSNKITIVNHEVNTVGDMKITKNITGVAANPYYDFEFTVVIDTGIGNSPVYGDYECVRIDEDGEEEYGTIYFADGIATFKLKGGEIITIKNLPKDSAYTVTENDYRSIGYSTEVSDASGEVSAGRIAEGEIIADETVAATFINSRIGWIEINKADALNMQIPLEGAEFTLYSEDGREVIQVGNTDENGKLWFLDIEPGTYILKETSAPDGYKNQWAYNGIGDLKYIIRVEFDEEEEGVLTTYIDDEPMNRIYLTNYPDGILGDLTIFKTLSGNAVDRNKDFEFAVTFSYGDVPGDTPVGIDGEYEYVKVLVDGTKVTGTVVVIDGKALFNETGTIKLKGGESVTIKYLPKGISYLVEEEDYSKDGYRTSQTGEEGTIEADENTEARFVNSKSRQSSSREGSLAISKTVTGEGGDKTKRFTFTINFSDKTGRFEYSGTGIAGKTLKDGDTFTLAHGESITITGIPEGVTYSVTEQDYSDEGYKTTSVNADGTIGNNQISTAKFTNNRDEDPEEPKDPEKPTDPGTPGEKPEKPDGSGILGEDDLDDAATAGGKDSAVPKTGDDMLLMLWILTMLGALTTTYLLVRDVRATVVRRK